MEQKVFLLLWLQESGNLYLSRLKNETDIYLFKTKIKAWTTSQCLCRQCEKLFFILVLLKPFLRIDFTILFNLCVLYLSMRCF